MQVIAVHLDRCTGCKTCELYCAIELASHKPAPLLIKAFAKDIDDAMTKKFDQPRLRSNSFHVNTPILGANKHAQASNAGNDGSRW